MISMTTKPHSVPSSKAHSSLPSEEQRIINTINKEVGRQDRHRAGKNQAYHVVRHGPQVNFNAFMLSEERALVHEVGGLIGAVANPDFPVAFCDNRGEWAIINNQTELRAYYESKNTVLKETWRDDGLQQLSEIMAEDKSKNSVDSTSDADGIKTDLVGTGLFKISRKITP